MKYEFQPFVLSRSGQRIPGDRSARLAVEGLLPAMAVPMDPNPPDLVSVDDAYFHHVSGGERCIAMVCFADGEVQLWTHTWLVLLDQAGGRERLRRYHREPPSSASDANS